MLSRIAAMCDLSSTRSDKIAAMGAWELGPFANDDALNWLGDLQDAPDDDIPVVLRSALTLPEGYVELPDASVAIAAASLLAMVLGMPADDESSLAAGVLVLQRLWVTDELRTLARASLTRVLEEDNEWRELWDEAELGEDAARTVSILLSYV